MPAAGREQTIRETEGETEKVWGSWAALAARKRAKINGNTKRKHLGFRVPCGDGIGGHLFFEVPCALPRMRSQALCPTSSTTTRSQRPLISSSRSPPATAGPQTCMTWRSMTTPSEEGSLHHCSPRSEKMQRAVDEIITLMTTVCRPVSRRLSVIERGDPLWNGLIHRSQTSEKIRAAAQKMSKSGFFWNDKESRFSLTVKQRLKNTSSKPIMTEEVFKNWMKWSSLKEEKLIVLIKETNNFDEINNFFMNNYLNKIKNFVKLMRKVSMRWKNWSDFKALHSVQFQGENFIEDRDTILGLTGKIQELQNEINCMSDSRDFQDAEPARSGQSHDSSPPAFFPSHPDPGEMPSRSLGMPSRNNGPPSIWDTHGISGNVFANPTASSSAPYPQDSNPWI